MAFKSPLEDSIVVLVCVFMLCCFADRAASQRNGQPFPNLKRNMQFLAKKDRPTFHNRVLNRSLTSQLSAARYMLNLYRSLDTVDDRDSQSFNISGAISGVDTIMGILNDATDNSPNSSNIRLRLKFNFTAKIQVNDSVRAAEFHIYKEAPKYAWMKNVSFQVELSMLTANSSNSTPHRKQLTKRVIPGGKTGWEVFDVTSTVDTWIISPGNNYGLEVSVTFPRKVFPIPVEPDNFGLVGFTGPYGERPFIVSFFKGDPADAEIVVRASNRKRRSSFNPKYGNKPSFAECRKKTLYVNFQDIGWKGWIVAPDGYVANYCVGECNYPLSYNATNHASVQALVHTLNPDAAPAPCCAPTKLKPINVLFLDDCQNIVLKKYHDMIVESCGCQ